MDSCSGYQGDQDEDEGWDGHKREQNQYGTDQVWKMVVPGIRDAAIEINSCCHFCVSFFHEVVRSHKIDRGNEEAGVGEDNEC